MLTTNNGSFPWKSAGTAAASIVFPCTRFLLLAMNIPC